MMSWDETETWVSSSWFLPIEGTWLARVEAAVGGRAVDRPAVLIRLGAGAVEELGAAGDAAALRFRQDARGHVDDREIAAADRQQVHVRTGDGGRDRRLAGEIMVVWPTTRTVSSIVPGSMTTFRVTVSRR